MPQCHLGHSADGGLPHAVRIVSRMRKAAAFTLVEMLVGLAIFAALVVVALPSYSAWIADAELRDEVAALVGALTLARSEALKENQRVDLCPSADGTTCAVNGRWEAGWIMFADDDHNGERDPGERIIRVSPPARPGITVRGNRPVRDYVSYTGAGHTRMANGALQMGTLVVCRRGQEEVDVVLANGGRVRIDRPRTPCP
jgi:type IV fimbrial biogenesis protein FimT